MKQVFLLLDDEPASALAFAKLLKTAHYEFIVASTVAHARELLESRLPHALVVDVHLGGQTNGLEWLASLSHSPFSGIPSVVLSASSALQHVTRAIDLNVIDYIIKPSSRVLIAQKIERLSHALGRSSIYSYAPGPGRASFAKLRVPGPHRFRREESVEIVKLNEKEIEVLCDVWVEPHSIAELAVGELELPVVIQESSWKSDGTVRVFLSIDPRVRSESATELRRLIVHLKRLNLPYAAL